MHEKYTALPELDVRTLIVPYTCGKHWSVYVLGERGFFHFDSMPACGLHSDVTIRIRLAKMWTVRSGYAESSEQWLQSSHVHRWIEPKVPEQNSGWACGFYMLRNIMEFIEALRHRPHSLGEVSENTTQLGV